MQKFIVGVYGLFLSVSAAAQWQYSDERDPMAGKNTAVAHIRSVNTLKLDFPYAGKNHAFIKIQQQSQTDLRVQFTIAKGQLVCSAHSRCYVQVKFDDEPPTKFFASPPADHSSNVVFLNDASQFVTRAATARRILVQANIYQEGAPILEFSSQTPLSWKSITRPTTHRQLAPPSPPPKLEKPAKTDSPSIIWPTPTTDFVPSK